MRPAATVVVLAADDDGAVPRIVMVRRSARSRFMPSTYVFPGGRVEPGDGDGEAAFAAAAVRECAEETGLVLPAGELVWFDTWRTPSAEPRRYEARFFAAFVGDEQVAGLAADGRETFDLRCETADAFLDAWRAGEADLPPPTLATLLRLAGRTRGALRPLLRDADPRAPILPKWVRRDGRDHVFLPHARAYGGLPGEALEAPPRCAGLPEGFVREENRWRPLP